MKFSFSFTSLRFRVVVSVVSATLLLCVPLAFTESVHIQTFDQDYVADDDLADFRTASGDATLSSISLVGVSLNESFSSEKTEYTADASVSETTVSAVATHDTASIVMPDDIDSETDGTQVALAEGETVIRIVVTAEDGVTEQVYTVTVSRQVADTTEEEADSGDSDTQQVLLPDEQGADTQTFTGKLSIALKSATDTGVSGDGITSDNRFKFVLSSTVNFPSDDSDDRIIVYKAFQRYTSVNGSFSCGSVGGSIPSGSINYRGGSAYYVGSVGFAQSDVIDVTTTNNIDTPAHLFVPEGRHCYLAMYYPSSGNNENSIFTSHSNLFELTLDRSGPTITVVEPTTGKVYAYANEMSTVKTKDNVLAANCTDSTSTASGWSDYVPNGTPLSFSGSGRCFIFTDAATNKKAAHSSAKTSGSAFTDYDTNDNNLIDIDGTDAVALWQN